MTGVCRALAAVAVWAVAATPALCQTPAPTPAPAPVATPATHKNVFKVIAGDYRHFFSPDTARVLGMMSVATIAAVPWDRERVKQGVVEAPASYRAGNIGGSFPVQLGIGVAMWGAGRAMGKSDAADAGWDIVRGQALSQGLVQALKVTIRRERPDGSNHSSFPSGHSASSFATAGVLHRHFGWKVAVPAYAYGAYVAAARMSANKHHISDVVMGAGIGLASARTVTLDLAGGKFGIGVAPTRGGASVTFTRRP